MKKFLITFLMLVASTFVFAEGNWWEEDSTVKETPKTESTLKAVDSHNFVVKDEHYYILTLEISQSHFTLDLSEHLKDAANKITIEIPVDKDYYDSCYVGKEIVNDFRMGSLIFKSSIGKWKIKVINKRMTRK